MRLLLMALTFLLVMSKALAGPLEPPAAPASTYKTLDQVEPRRPISQSDLPLVITQGGSYYLTDSMTAPVGDFAIFVGAHDVEIDLSGFTLASVDAAVRFGIVSEVSPTPRRNVTVRHGTLKGFHGSAISSTAPGLTVEDINIEACGNGIVGIGAGSVVRNCRILDIGGSDATMWVNGTLYGIILGDRAIVEDCIVDGLVNTYGNLESHGIRVLSAGVIRNCTVANMTHEIDATAHSILGIRASTGSIVEACNVREIGNSVSALGVVRGIWANETIVRNNQVRGIRNAQSFSARAIEVIAASRVENNHVSHVEARSALGIVSEPNANRTVILGNTVQRFNTPDGGPETSFYHVVGIMNHTSGGVTQGNFIDITSPARLNQQGDVDQVLRVGIDVLGLGSRVISNEINSTLTPPGPGVSQATAIYIHPEPTATRTYLAANIASGCELDDNSASTILASTPAPNYFGP